MNNKKQRVNKLIETVSISQRDIDLCLNCIEIECKGHCKLFKNGSIRSSITQNERATKNKTYKIS